MMKILKAIAHFFEAEKTEYWHRDRSIEIVAKEKGIDIDVLKEETKAMLEKEGRVETIAKLRHRFHVPLSAAWRFVDKLDLESGKQPP